MQYEQMRIAHKFMHATIAKNSLHSLGIDIYQSGKNCGSSHRNKLHQNSGRPKVAPTIWVFGAINLTQKISVNLQQFSCDWQLIGYCFGKCFVCFCIQVGGNCITVLQKYIVYNKGYKRGLTKTEVVQQ